MDSTVDTQSISVVDLFSGCGGVSAGFLSTNTSDSIYRVVGGLDLDVHANMTFEREIGLKPQHRDALDLLETPEGKETLALWKNALGGNGIVVGGPPCQGFSAHRKKDAVTDIRNNLLLVYAKIAVSLDPEFVVMENVPEIFDVKHWSYFETAKSYLEHHGYRVRAKIYNLADFGVPQERFRALMVARRGGKPFNMLSPPTPGLLHRTVRDAIGHLPMIRAGNASPSDPMHTAPMHTDRILELISSIPKDGGSRRDADPNMLPACHAKVDGFRDVYGRLWWDRPSISITAKCSTPSCGRFLHPEANRNLSVREAALLQGFPAGYFFEGPLVQKYRQVGNAVPPLFAAAIASHLRKEYGTTELCDDPADDIHQAITKSFASSLAAIKKSRSRIQRDALSGHQRFRGELPIGLEYSPVIECFSGAGGLSLGLQDAGFHPVFAFDSDKYAVATYRQNIAACVEQRDANALSASYVLAKTGLRPGQCLLVAGGPPCQGFSQQGPGKSDDPRNTLVTWYANFLVGISPLFFILENVTYLDSKRGREIFDGFVDRLEGAGYKLVSQKLQADQFGVPQRRPRLFVIGYKQLPGLSFEFPPSLSAPSTTVQDAIGYLPSPPICGEAEHRQFANHVKARISKINELRISHVPPGGGWPDLPEDLQLDCHKSHKGDGHRDVFGRLEWDKPAPTITAHCDSFSRGRFAHPVENRPITAREAAALQSFPNSFRFVGPKKDVARLIGNAVPPRLAKLIGLQIKQSIQTWLESNPRNKRLLTDLSVSSTKAIDSLAESEVETFFPETQKNSGEKIDEGMPGATDSWMHEEQLPM